MAGRSPRSPSSLGAGIFAGFVLLAAVNAGAIALTVPLPAAGGVGLAALHHVFDAAETLGLGAVVALAVVAFARFARAASLPPWVGWCASVGATVVIVDVTNREFFQRVASQAQNGRFELAIFAGYLVLIGVCFTDLCRSALQLPDDSRYRPLTVLAAAVGLIGDHVYLRDDYFSVHCLAAWIAAMIAGVALAPLAGRAVHALARTRTGRTGLAALALFALFGVAWPPSNAARYELFRQPCAVAPWVLASTLWRAPAVHAPPEPPSRWDLDRSKAPPIPPTAPRVFPSDGVVVVITIDALRADVVSDPANDPELPTLAALKRDGVYFTHASAPATQTPLSLGTVFSGLYYSEERWSLHGLGSTRYLYPADDAYPRFPELLSAHGVTTVNYAGLAFLRGEFGVVRGFEEEKVVVEGRRHATAKELVDLVVERLKRAEASPPAGPLLVYTHLMEPHAPYDRGRTDGTEWERYVSEVAVADAAVARVVRTLEQGFGQRWALFVSADHGEAFGEHQTTGHAKTLYEELLHVPLLVRSPLFPPRVVDERVGLIDLGPTLLDLFGVDTPATFNGQSLAPILAGGTETLTRPLFAEGRLRRALTQADGFKVIDDPRRKLVETYDLSVDPGETRNLFDADPARSERALAALRTFFAVHTREGSGYETPYDP